MQPDASPKPFRRVAVLGLGLMGGSLARALRTLGPDAPDVIGWSPVPGEVAAARDAHAVAAATGRPEEAAAETDLVVLATPLEAACGLLADIAPVLGADATLTDLVSLKAPVARAVADAGLADHWVGSHPMCGSERSGFAASRPDLYRKARVWLTAEGASQERIDAVSGFWASLGADATLVDAQAHDERMALVSHLPQLTANALAVLLEEAGMTPADLGPGGRDMTRLAASSPAVWRDLLAHAPDALPEALRALSESLDSLAGLVEGRDEEALNAWMAATREWRTDA